jgi:hypothetical protein
MMLANGGSLQTLAGGLRVKARVQHPQVKPRKDRQGWPWVFRYWADEVQAGGFMKTLRKYQEIALSKGEGAITKKQADVERDKFMAKLNAPLMEDAVQQVAATGVAFFGEIAKMYEDGYLGRMSQIARPTREKEEFYLRQYIVPKWRIPSESDPAESGGGLAAHGVRFLVDDAWCSSDHESRLQSCRGAWTVGRGKA